MKVFLMLIGVFGGSFMGSCIGRLLGIDGVYTLIGSVIGAAAMYWLWRRFLDDDGRLRANLRGDGSKQHRVEDRAELLHEMMEERRRARIGTHRRNNDD